MIRETRFKGHGIKQKLQKLNETTFEENLNMRYNDNATTTERIRAIQNGTQTGGKENRRRARTLNERRIFVILNNITYPNLY